MSSTQDKEVHRSSMMSSFRFYESNRVEIYSDVLGRLCRLLSDRYFRSDDERVFRIRRIEKLIRNYGTPQELHLPLQKVNPESISESPHDMVEVTFEAWVCDE